MFVFPQNEKFKCFKKVLSPVFTVHWGLAKKKGRPTWRERFFFLFLLLFSSNMYHILVYVMGDSFFSVLLPSLQIEYLDFFHILFLLSAGKTLTIGRGFLTSRRSCMPGSSFSKPIACGLQILSMFQDFPRIHSFS